MLNLDFFVILILLSFVFVFTGVEMFYKLQLSGYNCLSVFYTLYRQILNKKFTYFFILIYSLLSLSLCLFFEVNLILVFLLLEVFVFCFFTIDFSIFKKVKFTKRLMRIFVLSVLLFLFLCCLFYKLFFDTIIYHFVFLISILLVLLSVLFSVVILFPLDKIICCYFIGKAKRKISKSNVIKIGITGSFGKTSVKEILWTILKEKHSVLSTRKSFNTPLGIARTINENMCDLDEIFVCEMGAKKRGEINYLCKMIDVDFGIVTTVGRQHLQTFGSLDNVYLTKKELPDYVSPNMCVFNLMNDYVYRMYNDYIGEKVGVYVCMSNKFNNVRLVKNNCGFSKNCAIKGVYYFYPRVNVFSARRISMSHKGVSFSVYSGNKFLLDCSSSLIGLHSVINILLAIAMAVEMGVSKENIVIALRKLQKITARTEIFNLESGGIVINNGYNSNIDSAKFSLMTLDLFVDMKKIVVTPGLIETGDDYLYNRQFGCLVGKFADEVIVVKDKNKKAICEGLISSGFDMNNVSFANSFSEIKDKIYSLGKGFVCLIENDLPDNFK